MQSNLFSPIPKTNYIVYQFSVFILNLFVDKFNAFLYFKTIAKSRKMTLSSAPARAE